MLKKTYGLLGAIILVSNPIIASAQTLDTIKESKTSSSEASKESELQNRTVDSEVNSILENNYSEGVSTEKLIETGADDGVVSEQAVVDSSNEESKANADMRLGVVSTGTSITTSYSKRTFVNGKWELLIDKEEPDQSATLFWTISANGPLNNIADEKRLSSVIKINTSLMEVKGLPEVISNDFEGFNVVFSYQTGDSPFFSETPPDDVSKITFIKVELKIIDIATEATIDDTAQRAIGINVPGEILLDLIKDGEYTDSVVNAGFASNYPNINASGTNLIGRDKNKKVFVKYVDGNGIDISESDVLLGYEFYKYEATPKEIPGWTLKERPSNEKGTFSNEEQTVTYVYERT
ncbi:MucBP domain-containing protein, partial [Enterococcus faecalis]|uniref:MucBP domain-containing protein n=1 Tax=Enterococcus faecalis TaxID=1351 RepID=UPI00325B8EB3